MRLISIGFGNLVSANRIVSIVSPESAPIKRLIQEVREKGLLIDASFGRSTKSVLFMDSGIIMEEGTPEEVFKNPQNPRTQDFLNKVLEI